MPPGQPPKKDVMLALLERASVFIHIDPRGEDVRVPPWFKKQPQLVLQVGLNMAVRIPDLAVEDDAVTCTLSFSRSPFFCYLPFRAVFALFGEDGKGMIWPNDVPKEVIAQQAERAAKEEARARLRPADAPAPASPGPPAEAAEAAPKAKSARRAKGKKQGAPPPSAAAAATESSPTPAEIDRERPPERRVQEAKAKTTGPAGDRPSAGVKRPLPPYLRVVK